MTHAPASGLPGTPKPLRAPEAERPRPSALPRPLTSFIGREADIDAVLAMLGRDNVRLVTLTGPGGVGKTRVALRVAEMVERFPDGRWFVPLATVTDPDLVLPTVAWHVGASRNAQRSPEENLAAHLRDANALVVLDNFEQVLGAGPLVLPLLAACSGLKVLVTSRSVLRLTGEHVYTVPPLPVREPGGPEVTPDLEQSEAVRLFVDRARARQPGFAMDERTARDVAAICRRLDGLPLGIELAAARVAALSPRDLLDRLDARLAVLADGARDQPGRLRSLRGSISWSYELLPPHEQLVFRRLGVFAGPWTLEAAEAVVYGPGESRPAPVIDSVASLVDKHLIRHQVGSDGVSQYQLLETIREFAADLLGTGEEARVVQGRLSGWLVEIAQATRFGLFSPDGPRLFDRLELFAADIRHALDWLDADGDVERYLKIAAPAAAAGRMHGWFVDGRARLERGVSAGEASASPLLGQAVLTLATVTHLEGEEALAWHLVQRAISLLDAATEVDFLFVALTICGLIAQRNDDAFEAERYLRSALDLLSQLAGRPWIPNARSLVQGHLGNNAVAQGRMSDAKVWFHQAVEVHRSLGHEPGTGHFGANHPIAGLGDVARGERDNNTALAHYRHALHLARQVRDFRGSVYAVGGVAASLACLGEWRAAARLFGACEALFDHSGIHFGLEIMDRQRGLGLPEPWFRGGEAFGWARHIRDALWGDEPSPYPPIPDPDAAASLWAEGRGMTLDEAAAEALAAAIPPTRPADRSQAGAAHNLSSREVEVLRLLVEGRTDGEIADALFISRRTAATHVRHIYDKLGVSSRAEAAAWAVRNQIA